MSRCASTTARWSGTHLRSRGSAAGGSDVTARSRRPWPLIPGVVFSGSLDGHLRAYAADTGKIIWDVDTVGDYETVNGVKARGGSLNGPGATVVDGMLYVHSGYSSYMTGNVLLAFSVDGQ